MRPRQPGDDFRPLRQKYRSDFPAPAVQSLRAGRDPGRTDRHGRRTGDDYPCPVAGYGRPAEPAAAVHFTLGFQSLSGAGENQR